MNYPNNDNIVTFPEASRAWGTITHVAIFDIGNASCEVPVTFVEE